MLTNSKYEQLDDIVMEEGAFAAGVAAAKFCSFGFVTSKKWFSCYCKILDGKLTLYEDERSANCAPPQGLILEIKLTKDHQASAVKRKNYINETLNSNADMFCFYVEEENGLFGGYTRCVKIGLLSRELADKLVKAIDINTRKIDPRIA